MKVSRSSFAGNVALYDSFEAAQYLGVTRQTVCTMARSGRLQGQLLGAGWYFTEQALTDFLKGRTGCRRGTKAYSRDATDRLEYDSGEDGFHAIQRPLR